MVEQFLNNILGLHLAIAVEIFFVSLGSFLLIFIIIAGVKALLDDDVCESCGGKITHWGGRKYYYEDCGKEDK